MQMQKEYRPANEKHHPIYAEESGTNSGRMLEEKNDSHMLKHRHDDDPYRQPKQDQEIEEAMEEELMCAHFFISLYVLGHLFLLMILYLTFEGVFLYGMRRITNSLKVIEMNPNGLDIGQEI